MSLQVFLQAQMLDAEEFLASRISGHEDYTAELMGRCAWLGLICEVLPRALLAELKLSRMLLGSSSAEQFLLVLAEEDVPRANEFLTRCAEDIAQLSGNTLRLVWATTENLGPWPIARKRLDDALLAKTSAPLSNTAAQESIFAPFSEASGLVAESYFVDFAAGLPSAAKVGWSSDRPAHLIWDHGQYSWTLKEQSGVEDEGILFPRRFAMDEAGRQPASIEEIAARADGQSRWGVLRGDVDHFNVQLRRVGSIEEHIHISVLFKEFFAGELSLLATLGDFWRKVTLLYRGGEDFALFGTWDALLMLAREMQRVFEKFIEQNFQAFPGLEAKTVSMALSIAPEGVSDVSEVFKKAGMELRAAKASEAGTFHLFGRTLEWKRLSDAEELKASLVRLVRDFGYAPEYIDEVGTVYRETLSAGTSRRRKPVRMEKPWRTYMRLSRVIPQGRGKELNSARNALVTSLTGKRTGGLKLLPSARVALEWARLAAGNQPDNQPG